MKQDLNNESAILSLPLTLLRTARQPANREQRCRVFELNEYARARAAMKKRPFFHGLDPNNLTAA